jgi:opacity protein-like surface antigen
VLPRGASTNPLYCVGNPVDVRAGVSWLLENEMGLCIEYRYSQFETDFEQGITDGTLSFNPSLQMHHLLFGITF